MKMPRFAQYGCFAGLIVLAGIFYLSAISPDHDWGDDFAQYIIHAKNLALGIEYSDTGYIFNPHNPVAPEAYPPLFPLLLSVVYGIFGLNFVAMKVEVIVCLLASFWFMFFVFRERLPFGALIAFIGLMAFNPWLKDFKEHILSEIPFAMFAYLSLLLIDRLQKKASFGEVPGSSAVLTGIAMYMAYATKSIGIVIPASCILLAVLRRKRLVVPIAIAAAVFLALMAAQNLLLHTDSGYARAMRFNLQRFPGNLSVFIGGLSDIYFNSAVGAIKFALLPVSVFLALKGFTARARKDVSVLEPFSFLYSCTLFVLAFLVPFDNFNASRYLLPVMPAFLYYIFTGIAGKGLWRPQEAGAKLLTVFVTAVFTFYALAYVRVKPLPEARVMRPGAAGLFAYISNNTGKDDVCVFIKPRVLTLFTQRKACVYYSPTRYQDFWDYLKSVHASYLIVIPVYDFYLLRFIQHYRDSFRETFSNGDFQVYRIEHFI